VAAPVVLVVPSAGLRADLATLPGPQPEAVGTPVGAAVPGGLTSDPAGVPGAAAATLSLLALVVLACAVRLRLT
jgi:hypothetical protein